MKMRPVSAASIRSNEHSLVAVLGVVYVHTKTRDGGDLYLTRFGTPHADVLAPENWHEKEWFGKNSERLLGTSSVYRVKTKAVAGRSLDLVVKNSRVGEDVPIETKTLLEFVNAEFNSPWEEFALVMELREGLYGPPDLSIRTQEPLAIYVPSERMQLWQTGRSRQKISRIHARHPGVDIDILRQYKLVYGWIKGRNAVEALEDAGIYGEALLSALDPVTRRVTHDLDTKGFAVADMKPAHIIIEERTLTPIADSGRRSGWVPHLQDAVDGGDYSVIDYELLSRTPHHEHEVKWSRRHRYLEDVRNRMTPFSLPSYLRAADVFGVSYVYGHVESTGGQLWVVGRNPDLFDYFLPERWRKTHAWQLSARNDVYYTVTKDAVHLVWKTSRVGEVPDGYQSEVLSCRAREWGFNSPFEEFAIARDLSEKGIAVVYARAIYATGTKKAERSGDIRRFQSHRHLVTSDGFPVLRDDHNYIAIWGYYNGPDEWVARQNGPLQRPVDLQQATARRVISASERRVLFDILVRRLKNVGYDGTLLEPNDVLLVLDMRGGLVKDGEGKPEMRISSFELLRRI